MNQQFINHAKGRGQEGEIWLKNIPRIVASKEEEWNIRVIEPFPNLSYNYVAPAVTKEGKPAVIKIGFPKDPEFFTEMEALQVIRGDGTEELYKSDKENAVMLLERLMPGSPLSTLPDDEQATRILCSVMKKLWKPLPKNNSLITIRERIRELPEYIEKHKGKGNLPWKLLLKANELFEELIATSDNSVLVHGDLHQDNVLSSERDGWLAIDPKGIAAEPAYETSSMIRHPYEKMRYMSNLPAFLKRRILIMSEELGFDPKRIHKWCIAQSVLSAVWNDTGPKGSGHAIVIAEALVNIVF